MRPAGLLLLAVLLAGGEELVCRGFDAATAASALSGSSGRRLAIDAELARPGTALWFALPAGSPPEAGRQALAHALDCWWTPGDGGRLTRSSAIAGQEVAVRAQPAVPGAPPEIEAAMLRLMAPWLSGDGGLARDADGTWVATLPDAGHARLAAVLGAMADPVPQAPHLMPDAVAGAPLSRMVAGADLGEWAIALARAAGMAVALGAGTDPRRAAPAPSATWEAALAALAAAGLSTGVFHGCLGIGVERPTDRQHPAARAVVAVLPCGHLCRDAAALSRLATALSARVRPAAWSQPGWGLVPLPWRGALLVVGDPGTIHAVVDALDAADAIGLDAWLGAGAQRM